MTVDSGDADLKLAQLRVQVEEHLGRWTNTRGANYRQGTVDALGLVLQWIDEPVRRTDMS